MERQRKSCFFKWLKYTWSMFYTFLSDLIWCVRCRDSTINVFFLSLILYGGMVVACLALYNVLYRGMPSSHTFAFVQQKASLQGDMETNDQHTHF